MTELPKPFDFEYVPTRVVYGRGCVDRLAAVLDEIGAQRALVVCGSNVAANDAVIDPIEAGLGEKLVGVFDETTPKKRFRTVLDGAERVREEDVDIVIGVGGGSSLNVARAICSVAPLTQSEEAIVETTVEAGAVPSPEPPGEPLPNVAVPTTMPGADLSAGGSVSVKSPERSVTESGYVSANVGDSRLMAVANFYDPNLYATTPMGVLASSAMNGFDKGIETLYSREATPIAKAHATLGLEHYYAGITELVDAESSDEAYDHAVLGTILVQYGRKTNVIHTFGNGVSLHHDVQQGVVHGIVAPHVLEYVFDTVQAQRYRIADALGIDATGLNDDEVADEIITAVIRVRDALGLPTRLRDVGGIRQERFPEIATEIHNNYKHERNPPGLDPTREDVLSVLEAAW
ncbi:iron-containing alcohol dehydrogenase family protein [Halorubrum sp. DTA98]|uniref:iron-containing alcohol dehydrogenase family protein n=1 Tax=Halorubrum sp. DTA98 TaxID=3402163 RepID=UPI003AAFCAD3